MEQKVDIKELNERIEKESSFVDLLTIEMNKVTIGQKHLIESLLVGLLSNGHILLEGVPGLAKTLAIKSLANTINAKYSRIQFTPDLLPADLLGTMIYSQKKEEFTIKKGPIFANFILADEINRAPAKVQSALLEAMQERQITIGESTFKLEEPFLVMATQNPIEQEGTYRLPEAQLDRFIFKINVTYPELTEEIGILQGHLARHSANPLKEVEPQLSKDDLVEFRELVSQVHVEESVLRYIATLVNETRSFPDIYLGGSPRASVAILRSSQAYAALQGRDFVTPEDIKSMAIPVLRHRIILTPEKEMEGVSTDQVIEEVINKVEVPR
jgi:MoxR-like ATPase